VSKTTERKKGGSGGFLNKKRKQKDLTRNENIISTGLRQESLYGKMKHRRGEMG